MSDNCGEPERATHSSALQDVHPSVRPVGVCLTSGVCLAYDRISKWKIVMLRRPLDQQHAYKSSSIMHDSTESSLLRFTPVLQTTYYRLVENCRLRGQVERDSLGNLGYSCQVQCSLVPSPTSSFSLLSVRCLQYGKRRKAGRGTRNEATMNLKLQTVNDERHRRSHHQLLLHVQAAWASQPTCMITQLRE